MVGCVRVLLELRRRAVRRAGGRAKMVLGSCGLAARRELILYCVADNLKSRDSDRDSYELD
jgi:hypothetical protein